ncbi:Imm59 family immunity protein [Listeria aquatica]|uniref:Imm59 family immunity protein n=1 Tax=Listeria aquatica TaxID=1494960 RepID=UPI0031F53DAF
MNEEIIEYKKMLEEAIDLLGYTELRYSLFAGRNNNRAEYQARIEFIDGHFEVYMTGERASAFNSVKYDEFFPAYTELLQMMQFMVLRNRRSVKEGKEPEYPCPLWDNEKAE